LKDFDSTVETLLTSGVITTINETNKTANSIKGIDTLYPEVASFIRSSENSFLSIKTD
jgi:hypothetical protein